MLKNIKNKIMLLIALYASGSSLYMMGAANKFNIFEKLPPEITTEILSHINKESDLQKFGKALMVQKCLQPHVQESKKLWHKNFTINFKHLNLNLEQVSPKLFRCLKNIGSKRNPQLCNTVNTLDNLCHCPIPGCKTFKKSSSLRTHVYNTTKNSHTYNQHQLMIKIMGILKINTNLFKSIEASDIADMLKDTDIEKIHAPDGNKNTFAKHIINHGLTSAEYSFLIKTCEKKLEEAQIEDTRIARMHQEKNQKNKEHKKNQKRILKEHARRQQEAQAHQLRLAPAPVPPIGAIEARRNTPIQPVAQRLPVAEKLTPVAINLLLPEDHITAQDAEKIEALSTPEEVAALLASQEKNKRNAGSCDDEPDAKRQRGQSSSSDDLESTSDLTDMSI